MPARAYIIDWRYSGERSANFDTSTWPISRVGHAALNRTTWRWHSYDAVAASASQLWANVANDAKAARYKFQLLGDILVQISQFGTVRWAGFFGLAVDLLDAWQMFWQRLAFTACVALTYGLFLFGN
jgi:hypothetical protein